MLHVVALKASWVAVGDHFNFFWGPDAGSGIYGTGIKQTKKSTLITRPTPCVGQSTALYQHRRQLLPALLHLQACRIDDRLRLTRTPPVRLQQVPLPIPSRQHLQHRQPAQLRFLQRIGKVAVRLFQIAPLGRDLAEDRVARHEGGLLLSLLLGRHSEL